MKVMGTTMAQWNETELERRTQARPTRRVRSAPCITRAQDHPPENQLTDSPPNPGLDRLLPPGPIRPSIRLSTSAGIRQKDKPAGLLDDKDEYEVWVKNWAEIFDAAEKKLLFFQRQLNYEATDARATQHLRESYSRFIPDGLAEDQDIAVPSAS
ncbi:hypothetical protein ACFYPT_41715 [Streptomyces sp. NPDC005529]|uniref:hypothetical protein n=1 Tax=unclassified Streptomyces TaxID=2593676 RepID=UPI0033B7E023